jgi:hypothetical protein
MSYFSCSIPPLTLTDLRSFVTSDHPCVILGTHPETASSRFDGSTSATWAETKLVIDEQVSARQGENLFDAEGRPLKIVYEVKVDSGSPGIAGIQTFWAVISALKDDESCLARDNLTIYCHTSGGGSHQYYGPGNGFEANRNWIVTIKDSYLTKDSELDNLKGLDGTMAEAVINVVNNGYAYAIEQGANILDFAQLEQVGSAIEYAASQAFVVFHA